MDVIKADMVSRKAHEEMSKQILHAINDLCELIKKKDDAESLKEQLSQVSYNAIYFFKKIFSCINLTNVQFLDFNINICGPIQHCFLYT